jgi:hypothetical protein
VEILQGFYWAPVVEVKNVDAFITKNMYGLLQAGNVIKVPTLIGITSEENLVFNPGESVPPIRILHTYLLFRPCNATVNGRSIRPTPRLGSTQRHANF